jgi:CBS domain containing-hemolysin-like protein
VPVIGIVIFWMVHVLPEKIAHKRHHPQRQAIQTLCLLSLVFGGLLWPIAWLWAYTKPIGYKLAYGTEKHEDYFHEISEKLHTGALTDDEIRQLQAELDMMHARGSLSPALHSLRDAAASKADAPEGPAGASVQSRGA